MAGDMVGFAANGHTCQGYLGTPATGSGPGIVVLQEYWGLVDHIKDIVDRFAKAGFVALAPDLYHGETTKKPDRAGKLMMALNIAETEKDLRGAVQYLLDHPKTSGDRVGTVGFCLGGQLSLYAACANQKVGACVDFYGVHPNVHPPIQNLAAPVLGFFAEHDEFVGPEVVDQLEKKLLDAGKAIEFHRYAGAHHAFFNDARPEVYHAGYADKAWQRMVAFFKENLS